MKNHKLEFPAKINISEKYNLPKEILFCKRCTISNQRPRIVFDEEGICGPCRYNDYKRGVNWSDREKELQELCNRFRSTDGSHDVLVPCSGGKDSSFVAHQLKYQYGMNPLTVTWAPHVYTDIGWKNLQSFINSGFDHILGTANGKVHRLMTRLAFIHLGDPFQPFIYGQVNFPLRTAIQHGIKLIMAGENGEAEYGGDLQYANVPCRPVESHNRHFFSGLPPEFWLEHGITKNDIHGYLPPNIERIKENKTEVHWMSYYKYWDPQENYYYCAEHTGFQANDERTEGTYSKYASIDDRIDGFHYFLMYIKFGIGRATSDSAHEIRDGKISREEAVALVKRYDGEFPNLHFKEFLEYTGLTEGQFEEIIDFWRGEHVWNKTKEGWKLKSVVWE